jgi:pyruvate/2-oxoglutarate dehydrogenase complex dihydrolipoamide acyltransferase (E2) component
MATEEEVETTEEPEIVRVERWRRQELERAGYLRPDARRLAERHEVDLHQAVELVVSGCKPRVAAQILL